MCSFAKRFDEQQALSLAPGNHRASAWVRVAQPQASANWGQHFSRRIGAEVLVGFVEGDIDRPLVMGQFYNAELRPP